MIKVVFFGTPQIAVKSLECLYNSKDIELSAVVTQEDKPSGRGHKLTAPPVKQSAEKLGIKVFQTKSIRKDSVLMQKIKEIKPDFFVTFAFGQILSQEVLDIPKYSTINMHASLLPCYRGANPIQRCIYNGDKRTGITTMITVLELDAGDICLQETIDITQSMTDVELADIISEKAPNLIEKTLIGLKNGSIFPKKQDEDKVTFANKFIKTDGVINFAVKAENIINQIRAMCSWPNAYTIYNEKTIKVFKATVSNTSKVNADPGTVLNVSKIGIEVAVQDGSVIIEEIKPEGKGKMRAYDWANGSGIKKGDKLG